MRYFALIAGFIACLGLFALSAFAVERRTKEIGIRKVLGSSAGSIFYLLGNDFLKLILLANLCVWPLSWLFMSRWLENFPYRVGLSWTMFALPGLAALLVIMITVSFQILRASLANPANSLRYE